MRLEFWVIAATVAVTGGFLLYLYVATLRRYRGMRVICCPANQRCAAVKVDARHAAACAATGSIELRLSDCSRWPEKAGCGQDCLQQISDAPEDCLVRTILAKWYRGKACAYCGRIFTGIQWNEHEPALLAPAGEIRKWAEIAPEQIPVVLESMRPVCWNCSISEKLRQQHPELVVDRLQH